MVSGHHEETEAEQKEEEETKERGKYAVDDSGTKIG